jgi:hypothetical protein
MKDNGRVMLERDYLLNTGVGLLFFDVVHEFKRLVLLITNSFVLHLIGIKLQVLPKTLRGSSTLLQNI